MWGWLAAVTNTSPVLPVWLKDIKRQQRAAALALVCAFILGLRPPRAEALKARVAPQRVRDASALLLPSSPGVQMLMDWTGGALSWPMCRGIWLE